MEYTTPKELSNQFGTSLKTIYNHLKKGQGNIRTRKENGKTFVNFEDFQNQYNGNLQKFHSVLQRESEKQIQTTSNASEITLTKIQNELQNTQQRVNELTKYNSNLQNQASNYAILLSEEKNEKKEILSNFTKLQSELTERVEGFSKERLRRARKYYILLGISVILFLLLIGFFIVPLLSSSELLGAD